jgi:hypothetical protein
MTFDELWTVHPSNNNNPTPCWNESENEPRWDAQCAIRMGICLQDAGLDLSDYKACKCWFRECKESGYIHAMRAEELGSYLKTKLFMPEIKYNVTHESYIGRQGIVLFNNFWGPGNSFDHIDLWCRDSMTCGDNDYFSRSEQIWFWELE